MITGASDQTSKFGSSIGLRNSGTASITYNSNGYYVLSPTKNSCESVIPINSCTGLDDFIIEFDGYLNNTLSDANNSFLGLTTYLDNNNWQRLGSKMDAMEYGGTTSGTYSENDISGTSTPKQIWLHFKFTITNDSIHREVYNGSTLLYEDTRSYSSSLFTSTTKYGFPVLWNSSWSMWYKNLKIKPL